MAFSKPRPPEERKKEFSTGAKSADSVQTRVLSSITKIPER